MSKASLSRMLSSGPFTKDAIALPDLRVERTIRIDRAPREMLEGRMEGRRTLKRAKVPKLSNRLAKRLAIKSHFGFSDRGGGAGFVYDSRQRAVVKIHYFDHGSGGGGALRRHAAYVAREAIEREQRNPDLAPEPQPESEAHTRTGLREEKGRAAPFYDAHSDEVDGAAKAALWAEEDRRHFRVILAAEHGEALRDLLAYTREVMARAEASLGTKLQWVAVDHWDTDNPHTHLIIRGKRSNGRDLILPRAFVRHELRSYARDVATEWLGRRTPEQERQALQRETRRHAPTRLDRMIADQLPKDGIIRVAHLEAPNGDPALTRALKARMQELERLGLARPVKRKLMEMVSDWQGRLKAMELHLDIRKRLMHERTLARTTKYMDQALKPPKGIERGLGPDR